MTHVQVFSLVKILVQIVLKKQIIITTFIIDKF